MQQPNARIAEQLRAQLAAAGLSATEQERADLLTRYPGLLAGIARIAALDLTGLEPAYVLDLARTAAPAPDPRT